MMCWSRLEIYNAATDLSLRISEGTENHIKEMNQVMGYVGGYP